MGGSATESSPPQPVSAGSRTGTARAPARALVQVRRTDIEGEPPETAVDVEITVLTSRRLGDDVVHRDREHVVVVGEVDDVQVGARATGRLVERHGPCPIAGRGPATARP